MAFFDLKDPEPGNQAVVCTEACHEDHTPNNDTTPDTPGDKYDLKYEAAHAVDLSAHEDLPDDATYEDCLECHAVEEGDNGLRPLLHEVHMAPDSHYEDSCFGCHVVKGTAPDSMSYQYLNQEE